MVEIRVPSPKPGSGGAYVKMERKVGDFATAAVAVQLTLSGGVCQEVGIGLTNVGSVPIKAVKAEAALRGKRPDEPPSSRRPSSRRRRPTRPRTCAAPSSTRRTWCGY